MVDAEVVVGCFRMSPTTFQDIRGKDASAGIKLISGGDDGGMMLLVMIGRGGLSQKSSGRGKAEEGEKVDDQVELIVGIVDGEENRLHVLKNDEALEILAVVFGLSIV